jgi:hypothetical protein
VPTALPISLLAIYTLQGQIYFFLHLRAHRRSKAAMSTPMQYPKENQGPIILGATLTVTIAALITFIMRMYVRVRMIRNVGWDVSTSQHRSR